MLAMYTTLRLLLPVFLNVLIASAVYTTPTRTIRTKRDVPSNFVSSSGGSFQVNGSNFKYVGTNAYWLSSLNSAQDIENTLSNISAAGIKVVRTWAFNDVDTIPENGTWFQLVANGTTTVNTGENGLQKLDTLVQLAEKHGIYLLFSLTNNWNPRPLIDNISTPTTTLSRRDVTPGTNNTLPRNYLSNDYGGMDAYVRAFGVNKNHDEFYTNETIINAFKNWTTQVVSRYVNSSAIFSWELANDPRCNSSLTASSGCNTQTITKWHDTLAQHVKSVDPNHLVNSGNHGFFCTDCAKLFPLKPSSTPQPSSTPTKRRVVRKEALTRSQVLKERVAAWRKTRAEKKRAGELKEDGVRIRGRWASTQAKRQDNSLGSAFDGSSGVDSEDILNIPDIGFGTFQLFPDQETYGPPDPNLPAFNNTVQTGIDWITKQAQSAAAFGKPITLTGFGLVNQINAPNFVPFNSSTAEISSGTDTGVPTNASGSITASDPSSSTFVTPEQELDAYQQWLTAGISNGINGLIQYQWGQGNLTTSVGTTISPGVTGISSSTNSTGQSTSSNTTGQSPNDGYSNQGVGADGVQTVLSDSASQQQSAADD
ncbi:glycoside hydrolase family 5 protein [Plicaturopsis crispa FD-325 SS-3]|nr:glycoside hydrolase family 5 protein [Plicaturopsis crispa FD-325 SS-3]